MMITSIIVNAEESYMALNIARFSSKKESSIVINLRKMTMPKW